jgi:hypothetical protein
VRRFRHPVIGHGRWPREIPAAFGGGVEEASGDLGGATRSGGRLRPSFGGRRPRLGNSGAAKATKLPTPSRDHRPATRRRWRQGGSPLRVIYRARCRSNDPVSATRRPPEAMPSQRPAKTGRHR